MGSFMSSALDANMKKQQDFMAENQVTMLERNINMQNAMRERMMATQIAGARELFNWTGSFYVFAVLALGAGAIRARKPQIAAPIIPLSWIVGYQGDMAYNGKMLRITDEAENILKNEIKLVDLAMGVPTLSEIDFRRATLADAKKTAAANK